MVHRISGRTLDSEKLMEKAVGRVRLSLGLIGAAALILGVLIVLLPDMSAIGLTWLLGVYWAVAGIAYILVALVSQGMQAWSRVLDAILGLMMVVVAIIAVIQPVATAMVLGVFLGIYLGLLWIVEGVVAIVQSGDASSRTWALVFGVLSLLAGLAVLTSPLWGVAALFLFAGILLIVLGIVQIWRAIRFGRGKVS